jgi:hypothetical protein
MMLEVASPELPAKVAKAIAPWMRSLERWQRNEV